MELVLAKGNSSSFVCLAVAELVKDAGLQVSFGSSTSLKVKSDVITGTFAVARYLAKVYPWFNLYGQTILEEAEVDHWLEYSLLHMTRVKPETLESVNKWLSTRTYLVSNGLTLADLAVFAQLKSSVVDGDAVPHLMRWFDFMSHNESIKEALGKIPQETEKSSKRKDGAIKGSKATPNSGLQTKMEEGGKFIELPGASEGNVVVRFPPEAGGYLHIGHAKAALLNQYYQLTWKGKLVMRFDDTNPEKEKVEFEKVILEDVAMLGIKPDIFSRTSDHFELIIKYAEDMIKGGLAFVDDTTQEEMARQREEREASKNRDNSFERNWQLWQEMVKGSEIGLKCCLRAKIDYASANGCLRDPTMFRCKIDVPHPHTGFKYKVYPIYDFACPIVDSVEGVTHALRTTEYHDRDPQYYWFIEKMGLRKVHVWEYSRLNLQNTVLSKRKLTWFVEQGLVDGWDDPRMPTVRGVLRRGMTVEGLKEFIIAQGSSRSVVMMEWDKLWAYNRKVIDPIVPRYTAIAQSDSVKLHLEGVQESKGTAQKHPKNKEVGLKDVFYSSLVLLEGEDASTLKQGDKITLINWGNAIITSVKRDEHGEVLHLEGKLMMEDTDYKNTIKLTWLAQSSLEGGEFTPTNLIHYDVLITKGVLKPDDNWKDYVNFDTKKEYITLGDPMLRSLKKGDIIQLQRRGYYICDAPYMPPSPYTFTASPCILISIPDGHTKTMQMGSAADSKGKSGAPKKNKAQEQPDPSQPAKKEPLPPSDELLSDQIVTQGQLVRQLKAEKKEKSVTDAEVKKLLDLKARYKEETGKDWTPPSSSRESTKVKPKLEPKEPKPASPSVQPLNEGESTQMKKQTRLGLEAQKEHQLSDWYSQVITRSEMIEYYDISGCYVLRPWSYNIWESIKDFFDSEIKKLGVVNCYFPIFVSKAALEREKEHIEDFAPEVAWVTKSGQSDLQEPIAIRPTSETVMYPAYARWIRSHRDLPLRLNQWCNVVRWEFKHPQPFLRTREFLWQEGHTAFATKPEAEAEALQIQDLYRRVYEDLLAIPVIPGKKTMKEKFAGSDYSLTVEGYISASGRGIQGATSHHLGQNFSKMFDIGFEDPDTAERVHVYQNSWGITTRTIGVMVLVHGDNKGLVLPPRVACIQVVIVPCGITAQTTTERKTKIYEYCQQFHDQLLAAGVRVHFDGRENYSPGWKFHDWELKGIPIRVDVGPREVLSGKFVAVFRDNGMKEELDVANGNTVVKQKLEEMQTRMFKNAQKELNDHVKVVMEWRNFVANLDNKNIIVAPFCLETACEDRIKKDSQRDEPSEPGGALMGAKALCIPFDPPKEAPPITADTKCIHCDRPAKKYTLFGRSY